MEFILQESGFPFGQARNPKIEIRTKNATIRRLLLSRISKFAFRIFYEGRSFKGEPYPTWIVSFLHQNLRASDHRVRTSRRPSAPCLSRSASCEQPARSGAPRRGSAARRLRDDRWHGPDSVCGQGQSPARKVALLFSTEEPRFQDHPASGDDSVDRLGTMRARICRSHPRTGAHSPLAAALQRAAASQRANGQLTSAWAVSRPRSCSCRACPPRASWLVLGRSTPAND